MPNSTLTSSGRTARSGSARDRATPVTSACRLSTLASTRSANPVSLYDSRPDGAASSPAPEIRAHTGVPSGSAMRATRVTSSPLMTLPRRPSPPGPSP
ncbi:hypothetical protein [Streptomyces sp. yr375]|uniref:hypothetical protein n=1 Tax=Streptomyces sp. yr375 TaxID=1761906 RepID=UPI0015A6153A